MGTIRLKDLIIKPIDEVTNPYNQFMYGSLERWKEYIKSHAGHYTVGWKILIKGETYGNCVEFFAKPNKSTLQSVVNIFNKDIQKVKDKIYKLY